MSDSFGGVVVRKILLAVFALSALAALVAPAAQAVVTFPDGVRSGDVTSTRAILWSRTSEAANVHVRVYDNPSATGQKAAQGKIKTSAANDFVAKIDVTGLQPGTQYYYRFDKDESFSDIGAFRTAPDPNTPADVKWTYSGDSDGTKIGGVPQVNNFEVLPQAQAENGDFFVMDGDTIYSDSRHRASPATTLDEYRAAHKEVGSYPNMRNLLESTSTIATMDDHEVVNDYAAATVDPARFAAGRKAFLENWPIRESNLLHDPTCAGDPLYRTLHWGSNVDVFVLDERSCRSASVAASPCGGDLGPTLPPAVRLTFPFSLFFPGLPNPPAGCLAAINSPARTLLGPVQKAQFLSDLTNSTATYKMVVSEEPIQQFFVLPYDRWEGYGADRNDVLNTIQNNGIDNVLFTTTDTHATLQNQVVKDTYTAPTPIANEMVVGPIATDTFQTEVLNQAGPVGLFAVNAVMNQAGIDCRNLNKNSYGLVTTTNGGSTTITSKDDTGAPVTQASPAATCSGTYGP
jgi:phosphodiesterase/alkaline phosphatase D-like protein